MDFNDLYILERNFRFDVNLNFDTKAETALSLKKLADQNQSITVIVYFSNDHCGATLKMQHY